jgi:lipoprotein-anchoring transpeptidase ErfK/SrfK
VLVVARLRPAVGGPARLAGLVTAVVLLVAACSATGALSTADTSTNVTAAVPPASADAGPSMTGGGASASSSPRASTAKIQVSVADGATGVSVLDPVTVRVTGGELGQVAMTNPDGVTVDGGLGADQQSWSTNEPLGYGRTYWLTATGTDPAGLSTTTEVSFTTVQPNGTIFPSFEPPPDRGQVGVGQPLSVIFDQPPPDKAAAERTLSVTATPATEGGWYWVDARTVHWRPKQYWQAGTQVTLSANVYGKDLGGGLYGETDRTMTLTIGPSKIASIDDATKQMTVTIDGQVVRQIPVSMGRSDSVTVDGKEISFVTPSGIYVAQEKYPVKQMSSASYGLPTDYSLGYDSQIPLAVRLSNSGIFAHSAPWSVADQGVRNVSHGCINLPPDAAQWFYDTFGYGDIVTVTGTSTQLAPDDGYGDWNIPWDKWLQGSALN